MILHTAQSDNYLEVSYINKEGGISVQEFDTKPWMWVLADESKGDVPDTEFKNWDGRSVMKESSPQFTDLGIREFLLHNIDPEIQEELFAYRIPRVFAIDIEIDVRKASGFPDPMLAEFPIYSISITSPELKTLMLCCDMSRKNEAPDSEIENGLNEYFGKNEHAQKALATFGKKKFEYSSIWFNTEKEMLIFYWKLQKDVLHTVSAWNGYGFDYPYMAQRAKRLGINRLEIASPSASKEGKPPFEYLGNNNKAFKKDVKDMGKPIEVEEQSMKGKVGNFASIKYIRAFEVPLHRYEQDGMLRFVAYGGQNMLQSSALDTVAKAVIGIGKFPYAGSFVDLLTKETMVNFLTYGAIDTVLMKILDTKVPHHLAPLMRSFYSKISVMEHAATIAIGSSLFFDAFYRKNMVYAELRTHDERYAAKKARRDAAKENYEGGYVKSPARGVGKKVVLVDAKSLYPSAVRSMGYSPENVLKTNLTREEIFEAIKQGHRVSMLGTSYDRDRFGIAAEVMNDLMNERAHFKGIALHFTNETAEYLKKEIRRRSSLSNFTPYI